MVFPNIKILCFCDKSTPVMDVLYHLTLRMYFGRPRGTTGTALLEEGLFELGMDGDIQREGKEVFAPKFEGTIVNP